MSTKLQAEFCRAVDLLGGASAAARLAKIPRHRIQYWYDRNIPDWAQPQIETVIEFARDTRNHKVRRRPRWAERLAAAKLRLHRRERDKAAAGG